MFSFAMNLRPTAMDTIVSGIYSCTHGMYLQNRHLIALTRSKSFKTKSTCTKSLQYGTGCVATQ